MEESATSTPEDLNSFLSSDSLLMNFKTEYNLTKKEKR